MTLLAATNLTIAREEARLLAGVSFSANAGEFIGIVGPNGAGKSTLLRLLAGVLKPDAGSVEIGGAPLALLGARERARKIAYLPQNREVHWAMTGETIASLGRFAYGAPDRLGPADRAAVDRALAAADARSFRSRVASSLSGGELARIHLARTLAAEAPVLLADEPVAALDMRHALSILNVLSARAGKGGLVLAALHDLDLAKRYCTRVMVIDAGRLVADGAPDTALEARLIEQVFAVTHGGGGWRLAAPRS